MMLLQHAPCQPIATTRSDSPAATAILTVSGQHRRGEVADDPVCASLIPPIRGHKHWTERCTQVLSLKGPRRKPNDRLTENHYL
jgi:hypothetical protein